MNFRKNSKGITLIALVITIIVLLILAGVSLSLIMGNQGILNQATSAVETHNEAKIQEEIELAMAEIETEWYKEYYATKDTTMTKTEYITEKLTTGITTSSGATIKLDGADITYEKDDEIYTAKIDLETGKIGELVVGAINKTTQEYKSKHPELHIPTGFSYKEGTVSTGYVITDGTNEFVWIPVASSEEYTKTLGTYNWYVKSGSTGTDTASSLNNDITQAVQGDTLGVSSILGETVNATLDANQPEATLVNAAGGFWVGRYEAGIENVEHSDIGGLNGVTGDSTSANISNTYWEGQKANIVVKENSEPVRNITQTKALSIANSWKSGAAGNGTVAFQSGLITGSQWDAMCNFIGWSTCDSDCRSWGNYANVASASYTGYHSSDAKSDWYSESGVIKLGDSTNRWIFPTGKFVNADNGRTMKKNIYDVAGNVWEWTTEVPQIGAISSVIRGGSADFVGHDNLATSRSGYDSSTVATYWNIGFRLVLYVQ